MALQGISAVFYYGILASITGGYLPVRAKNLWLVVFHLYLFLTFIFFPLVIYLIDASHWAGWFVYTLFVLTSFVIFKVVNIRLHLSLGTDPVPEPEKKDQEAIDNEAKESDKDESKSDESKTSLERAPTSEELKAAEAGIVDSVTQEDDENKSLPSHSNSAELNRSSSLQITRSGLSTSYELQPRSTRSPSLRSLENDVTVVEIEDSDAKNEQGATGKGPVTSSTNNTLRVIQSEDPSAVALMSPVHRSSSNVDTSYTTVVAMLDAAASQEEVTKREGRRERHSISVTPSMLSEDASLPYRDRSQAGICIQRGRGATRQDSDQIDDDDSFDYSLRHHRRYAMRSGQGGILRRHSSPATARTIVRPASSPVLSPLPSSPVPPPPPPLPVSQATPSSLSDRSTLIENVKTKLYEDERYSLLDVVERMPNQLLEGILVDCIPDSCFESISSRVEELKRGHLANGDTDSKPGAIHWFEVNEEWNFYVFEMDNEETTQPTPSQDDDDLERYFNQEILLRYGMDIDDIRGLSGHSASPIPSHRKQAVEEEVTKEEEKKPTFEVIPFVKKTTVTLKFARKKLEEFMDRNVSLREVFGTVFLATMVCVIAALLLSVVNFYQGFWAFWLCFVVGTAHFSLVKSVQDDPASPSPGQNHITAMSRAIYFIVVGVIALCIDAALRHIDMFEPLRVYGFDVNSRVVLTFVRDGLLIFILFFPIVFALGWLPQADTFTIYFCEQIDMHIFGGTPATGLICGLYSVARSVLVAALVLPLGYAAFTTLELPSTTTTSPNDPGESCVVNDRVALSFYLGILFAASFVLSRSTSNHQYLWDLIVRGFKKCKSCVSRNRSPHSNVDVDFSDPLEEIYCSTLSNRFIYDLLAGIFIFIFVTGLNLTTIFCLSPIPSYVIYGLTCVVGLVNHYLIPHIRKEMPWLVCSEPLVKPSDWDSFEVTEDPKLSVVEYIMQLSLFIEKNILYPLTFIFAFNLSAHYYKFKFGDIGAAIVVTIAGMKIIRCAWTELSRQHFVLIFTLFFFNFDYAHLSQGLPLDYFIIAILFNKFSDLLLKMYFIYIYIAPWQTSWSSAGHIIVQPLLVPHTPIIFLQTLIAAIMSAPINPVYASTLFILSYVRPVKYWEKDYNTKRADSSNTRLDTQLEGSLRNPNPDRLDSLFYEHLTWVLQKDLCGDLVLGRWGNVTNGDIFILTSDRLNALVHIIEYGNGFVTFQLRGLEFRGTYCHQREVEAITESVANDESCCCYEPGHIPYFLSCNKLFGSRWLAWQVVSSCYTLHGYSITENQAHLVFNSFDFRRGYITYYCKCIIYKLITSSSVKTLLENSQLREALEAQHQPGYVDPDPLFDDSRNCDHTHLGIERDQFVVSFLPFIQVCVEQQEGLEVEHDANSFLVTLCFAYTLLGRRMFFQHAQQGSGRRGGDNFMHGLYRMFLGDARPHSVNDEWVFSDVDSIQETIIPAARIALKVHQDNFTFSEEYDSPAGVYDAIRDVESNHVVTHENDRAWRTAVVMNKPSMLALRYQRTEDSYVYPYKLIRLTSKFIKFRVVKLNRECVRSLWTSQQHELIFLRNSDSERGSIQNHKPTLRNMVNSSMDLPIGYPIYVSPLQTSYIDRHQSYNSTLLGKITNPLEIIKAAQVLRGWCDTCSKKVRESRNRSSSKTDTGNASTTNESGVEGSAEGQLQQAGSVDSLTGVQYGTGADAKSYEDPFPDSDDDEQLWKPMWVSKMVVISDTSEIFENFNISWLKWRDVSLAQKAMKSHWKAWRPQEGMEGEVVHEWRPFHIEAVQRSHIDKVILLVKMTEDLYVLIKEQGVKEVQ